MTKMICNMCFSLKLFFWWSEDTERSEIHYDINNVEKPRGTNVNVSQNLVKFLIACLLYFMFECCSKVASCFEHNTTNIHLTKCKDFSQTFFRIRFFHLLYCNKQVNSVANLLRLVSLINILSSFSCQEICIWDVPQLTCSWKSLQKLRWCLSTWRIVYSNSI
jgi:hypothetical protein